MKFHSTESKAFWKSKKSKIPSWFLSQQYSNASKIVLALVPINLPFMYAD